MEQLCLGSVGRQNAPGAQASAKCEEPWRRGRGHSNYENECLPLPSAWDDPDYSAVHCRWQMENGTTVKRVCAFKVSAFGYSLATLYICRKWSLLPNCISMVGSLVRTCLWFSWFCTADSLVLCVCCKTSQLEQLAGSFFPLWSCLFTVRGSSSSPRSAKQKGSDLVPT